MSTYDEDYYFVDALDDESLPLMAPDDDTGSKSYHYKAVPPGSKPFIFHNGVFDLQREKGVSPMDPPPPVLFDGAGMMVDTTIRNKLILLNIPHLAIHPAIYIDHLDHWHENYWYLAFLDTFDCWDRNNSKYNPTPAKGRGPARHAIYTYSLNSELLDATPLENRQLFKMGGAIDGPIVAHLSIVNFFNKPGVELTKVSDY